MSRVLVREVVSVLGGGTPRRSVSDYYDGAIPWVTPKDMKRAIISSAQISLTEDGIRNSPAKIVPAGSVLVVVRSGVLKHTLPVARTAAPVAVNQDMKALVPSDAIDGSYLTHLVKALEPTVLSWVRATTADNWPIEKLLDHEFNLPPLPDQRRIAAILDQADALRAKRQQSLSLLDELRSTMFEAIFDAPSREASDQIDDFLESAQYGTSSKAGAVGDFPILRMGNLTSSGAIDLREMKYINIPPKVRDKYLVQQGDVLFNRTNSTELVGKTAQYLDATPIAFAGYLVRLRPLTTYDGAFISGYLNSRHGKATLRNMAKSIVGMANINAREARAIRVPRSTESARRTYAEAIADITKRQTALLDSSSKLDALFASLQHRAFRGEL